MSKGLKKDSDVSIISKMSKNITSDHLFEELLLAQKESVESEKSKDKQHLSPYLYKRQRKILKIILYYFTKNQKDFAETQLKGNQLLL